MMSFSLGFFFSTLTSNPNAIPLLKTVCAHLLKIHLCSSPQSFENRYINPLGEASECRRKVEWNDQAENLYQMYVDFSYILLVFSYIDRFLGFG